MTAADADFRPAGPADLVAGTVACRTVDGVRVLIARAADGGWHAVQADCSHMGLPLARGRVRGASIVCPHHGARFDLASGDALGPPAVEGIAAHAVRVNGEMLEVRLSQ